MTPTPLWTSRDCMDALGGTGSNGWSVTGVSIDTRTARPGDLFVALEGPNFDGHNFVEAAFEAGCAAAVVTRPIEGCEDRCIVVEDTMTALTRLGKEGRGRSNATVFAVTGSVGKTGTKEALRACLDVSGPAHATKGNLNNHIGVPLTLARLPAASQSAVIEIGMNHPGEIGPLSELARPHVAMITTVTNAHIEFFDDESGIAREKAQIFKGLTGSKSAVLPRDNRWFDLLVAEATALGAQTFVTFGAHEDADIRLVAAEPVHTGSHITVDVKGEPLSFDLGLPGRHWAANACGIVAALHASGINLNEAVQPFATLVPSPGRGERSDIMLEGGSLLLIDESYNASPAAVEALLDMLGGLEPGPSGRRILVLGDMLELGDDASALHRGLADAVARNGIDQVFTAGPLSSHLFEAVDPSQRGAAAPTSTDIAAEVTTAVRPGDIVAVKGSLGSKMGIVVDALKSLDRPELRHAC